MSPLLVQVLGLAAAGAMYVGIAFVKDPNAVHGLLIVASLLVGAVGVKRYGDVPASSLPKDGGQ